MRFVCGPALSRQLEDCYLKAWKMHQEYYEFSGFQLDVAQRVLTHKGNTIALPRKTIDVLLFLIQNKGRLVQKDELMNALWPDSFVEESNLSANIFILRKALSREQDGHTFIQTIPRRGYRFVAPVRQISELEVVKASTNSVVDAEEKTESDVEPITSKRYSFEAIQRYLLGQMSEQERSGFEAQYVKDPVLFDDLIASEDHMMRRYTQGLLSEAEKRAFEYRFLKDPNNRGRVAFAQSLTNYMSSSNIGWYLRRKWWQIFRIFAKDMK